MVTNEADFAEEVALGDDVEDGGGVLEDDFHFALGEVEEGAVDVVFSVFEEDVFFGSSDALLDDEGSVVDEGV